MKELSHFDEKGASRMVDVGQKRETQRKAQALAKVTMKKETMKVIQQRKGKKGDVLEVARLAGIMAAKQTPNLIPLAHPLSLNSVKIDFEVEGADCLKILTEVTCKGRTGVEMEALTAAAVCALTVYDMCKAIDRGMVIGPIHLVEKSGGKSGHFVFSEPL